jgi:general secretion pathway protein G
MRTSATCRRNKEGRKIPGRPATAGFTLIEILVVLVILGFIAGLALPGLQRMMQSAQLASERSFILGELGNLGYRAYITGRPITLGEPRQEGGAPPFDLPEGWRLVFPKPISYRFNGLCSGGSVTLISPDDRQETLDLVAPRCRIERLQAATS